MKRKTKHDKIIFIDSEIPLYLCFHVFISFIHPSQGLNVQSRVCQVTGLASHSTLFGICLPCILKQGRIVQFRIASNLDFFQTQVPTFWDIIYVSLLNTKLNQVDGYLKGWRGKLATLAENPSSTQGSSRPPLALASTGSCIHPSQVTLPQLKILI